MALSKNIKLISNFGDEVVFNDTYIKVDTYFGNKQQIGIEVVIYKSDKITILKSISYGFTPTMEDNFIKQGYEHIKSLPEYADAVDC